MLMSIAQLFLRRSTTWIFGLLFCLYYEAILLADAHCLGNLEITWGTRMTPSDVAAENRRKNGKKEFKRTNGVKCYEVPNHQKDKESL